MERLRLEKWLALKAKILKSRRLKAAKLWLYAISYVVSAVVIIAALAVYGAVAYQAGYLLEALAILLFVIAVVLVKNYKFPGPA